MEYRRSFHAAFSDITCFGRRTIPPAPGPCPHLLLIIVVFNPNASPGRFEAFAAEKR
jgi:hypothetical protein